MQTHYVLVLCEVHCKWDLLPPRYRLYIDEELFAERTWIWHGKYLEEAIQIQAPAGKYLIRFELLDTTTAQLKIKNIRVDHGNAVVHKGGMVEIFNESI